jgi:hypothetical protein
LEIIVCCAIFVAQQTNNMNTHNILQSLWDNDLYYGLFFIIPFLGLYRFFYKKIEDHIISILLSAPLIFGLWFGSIYLLNSWLEDNYCGIIEGKHIEMYYHKNQPRPDYFFTFDSKKLGKLVEVKVSEQTYYKFVTSEEVCFDLSPWDLQHKAR